MEFLSNTPKLYIFQNLKGMLDLKQYQNRFRVKRNSNITKMIRIEKFTTLNQCKNILSRFRYNFFHVMLEIMCKNSVSDYELLI